MEITSAPSKLYLFSKVLTFLSFHNPNKWPPGERAKLRKIIYPNQWSPSSISTLEINTEISNEFLNEKGKSPHPFSHRTMHEYVVHRFLLCHTKDTLVRQIPASILKMIEGKNFIQETVPNEKGQFGWHFHPPNVMYCTYPITLKLQTAKEHNWQQITSSNCRVAPKKQSIFRLIYLKYFDWTKKQFLSSMNKNLADLTQLTRGLISLATVK